MKKHYGQKYGDKSCQSNFDKQSSDFGSFLVIYLLLEHGSSRETFIFFSCFDSICHNQIFLKSLNKRDFFKIINQQ